MREHRDIVIVPAEVKKWPSGTIFDFICRLAWLLLFSYQMPFPDPEAILRGVVVEIAHQWDMHVEVDWDIHAKLRLDPHAAEPPPPTPHAGNQGLTLPPDQGTN